MKPLHSPLFEPVLWRESGFEILDELQLPDKISYIHVSAVDQALAAVREMNTRAFGQVLTYLYSGALIATRYAGDEPGPLRQQLAQMTEQFCEARPTFDFRGIGSFMEEWFEKLPGAGAAGPAIAAEARAFAQRIVRARSARAERTAAVLPNPARLLTHCNVSGELVAVAHYCRASGKQFTVIATETRPYLQGARLTAWELSQAGVPVTLIADGAVAQVLASGAANAVVVGADRSARNGDIINKVGTYPLALMAREYGVPFHALVQDPRELARGGDVSIEERPADELLTFEGQPLVDDAEGKLKARYPAFDLTPASLISHLIGFDGLYSVETFRQKFQGRADADSAPSRSKTRYVLLHGVPPDNQYAFLRSALQAEDAQSLLVPEMRPQLWGTRSVARELLKRDVPATVIADNMMGTLFAQGEIAKLCLFYNDLTEQGPCGNCGALLAVQLARLHGVAIELFSGAPGDGAGADADVATFMGKRIAPAGVAVHPTQGEVIPWALFKS